MAWELKVGETIRRTELHERFGGRRQGGIAPSARTPNVFLFTDPASGRQHGYFDGWAPDGRFHYTGEGQRGDQQLIQGNRTVLEHREQGRALRLFRADRRMVTYIGEFELEEKNPFSRTDAPETGNGPIRQVVVFHLVPVDDVVRNAGDSLPLPPADDQLVTTVPLEAVHTEKFYVSPTSEQITAERREQQLVTEYAQYLRDRGHEVERRRYLPEGETKPLYCDVFEIARRNLVEAKGTGTREAVRMAIGQLHDYKRFEPEPPSLAVLLPERPRPDLEALLASQSIAAIWRAGPGEFQDNADQQFT